MSPKVIHIVSFDVPYPPNYGGVIDVYFKCKSLFQLGYEIHLHCYQYGREASDKLLRYCKEVHYYKRTKIKNPFSGGLPFIVSTRNDEALKERLLQDNFPILFEGLHSTYLLNDVSIHNSRCYVRTHNIEHEYYQKLADVETNPFKKLFFTKESKRLLKYEHVLSKAKKVFAISGLDQQHFEKVNPNTILVSAFHETEEYVPQTTSENYVLYHGNLAVGENDHAACYLAAEVFGKLKIPAIIAGNFPSKKLRQLCEANKVQLLEKKTNAEITDLIEKAKVNVLVTFQKTGIKLKLLNALYKGGHCVVNHDMVNGTGLERLCHSANTASELVKIINEVSETEFSKLDASLRKETLQKTFDNKHNALILAGNIG